MYAPGLIPAFDNEDESNEVAVVWANIWRVRMSNGMRVCCIILSKSGHEYQ